MVRPPVVVAVPDGPRWQFTELAEIESVETPEQVAVDVDVAVDKWAATRKGVPAHWRPLALSPSQRNEEQRYDLTVSLTGLQDTRTARAEGGRGRGRGRGTARNHATALT